MILSHFECLYIPTSKMLVCIQILHIKREKGNVYNYACYGFQVVFPVKHKLYRQLFSAICQSQYYSLDGRRRSYITKCSVAIYKIEINLFHFKFETENVIEKLTTYFEDIEI